MWLAGLQRKEMINTRLREIHEGSSNTEGLQQILGGQGEKAILPKCKHSKGAGSAVHSKVYGSELRV